MLVVEQLAGRVQQVIECGAEDFLAAHGLQHGRILTEAVVHEKRLCDSRGRAFLILPRLEQNAFQLLEGLHVRTRVSDQLHHQID